VARRRNADTAEQAVEEVFRIIRERTGIMLTDPTASSHVAIREECRIAVLRVLVRRQRVTVHERW
jgi:hypothetical protein